MLVTGPKELTQYTSSVAVDHMQCDRTMQTRREPDGEPRDPQHDDEMQHRVTDARSSSPAPVAMPIAADSHTAAAVVSPSTAPRRVMMMPAPRNPIPETI